MAFDSPGFLLALLAGLLLAMLLGAAIALVALLAGMAAGVRCRQGGDPLPLFTRFLERHVAGRERAAAQAPEAGPPSRPFTEGLAAARAAAPKGSKEDPPPEKHWRA